MGRYRIAVLPGDGIGPGVMSVTLRVLRVAERTEPGLQLDFVEHEAGAERFRQTGQALPQAVLDDCLSADAVLLAAIGLPDVRMPDETEIGPVMMMGLRRALGLYAAVRPIKLYAGVRTPLADVADIDLVIIRENLEGLFASFGGGCLVNDQVATDTMVITRAGTDRVVDFAFQLARRRAGRPSDGRRIVTCVDKANVFRSFAFFRKVFFEVAGRYSDEIHAEAVYVDAAALYLVQRPGVFDVIVTENQFGVITVGSPSPRLSPPWESETSVVPPRVFVSQLAVDELVPCKLRRIALNRKPVRRLCSFWGPTTIALTWAPSRTVPAS